MVLKTDFTRSQENTQDDLNANFTEIQAAITTANYVCDGLLLMDAAVKSNYDVANYAFYRIGNAVLFNARVSNKVAVTTWQDLIPVGSFPDGFKPSQQNGTWNIPLSVVQQNSGTSAMKAIMTQDPKLIFFSQSTGNHYISGTYYTEDPMPEA